VVLEAYTYHDEDTHKPSSHLVENNILQERWNFSWMFFLSPTFNSRRWPSWLRSSKLGVPLSYEERGCEIPDCAERAVTLEPW